MELFENFLAQLNLIQGQKGSFALEKTLELALV
jgi:hypothetical protein